LDKLREYAKRDSRFNKKLALWFHRMVQFCTEYKAKERGLRVARVNPKGASSKCPKCSSKLADNGHRALKCGKRNFIGDRDVVATVNLYRKFSPYSICGEPFGSPQAPQAR